MPNLELYLENFAITNKKAVEIVYEKYPNNKLLEDYTILGGSISDIIKMPENIFINKYYEIMSPLIQIAKNTGFEVWK